MNLTEILKNNKLIAKFMGAIVKNYLNIDRFEWLFFENNSCDNQWHSPECLKYHKSWNWLMPCIINMASMSEYNKFRAGYSWPYQEGNPISCFSITKEYDVNLSFDILWKELIEFIEWYNKQKQKQNEIN